MKNILFSIIVPQCLFVVRGSYESSFSNSVGCLERTQVTVAVTSRLLYRYEQLLFHLMDSLSECYTAYFLVNRLQRALKWRNHRYYEHLKRSLSITDRVNIIENETFVEDKSAKQTLLYFGGRIRKGSRILKALEQFEMKKDRNVIIFCYFTACPTSHLIPFDRIVPITSLTQVQLINLIQSPNLNQGEYIKHIKIDDRRLECLTNKTIHIAFNTPAVFIRTRVVSLIESIGILVANIRGMHSTKIAYYTHDKSNYDYEKVLLDSYGITNSKNFNAYSLTNDSDVERLLQSFKRSSTDVYLFHKINSSLLIPLCSYVGIVSDRKRVVTDSQYFDFKSECKSFFSKVSYFDKSDVKARRDLIEEILSASCF